MQVVVNSQLVNYSETGKGPDMLLLHGWASSGDAFRDLAQNLSKNYHVIIPDLPGFGASEMPGEAWNLEKYSAFLSEFLKKIKADPKVVLAHSNGAAIAIKGLSNGSLTSEKLVILGGAGIRPKKSARKLILNVIAKTGKTATLVLPRAKRQKIRSKYYQKIGSDYRLMEGMEETFRNVVGEDVLGLAAGISLPTLLVYGENDESTPPLYGRLYHETMTNSQLEIIGGAGHFVFQDQPQRVLDLIKDFLK